MINVSHVDKTYRGVDLDRKENGIALWIKNLRFLTGNKAASTPALKDVSFEVQPGEIFGIFGANGAGKTTLIKVLSGLLVPDAGEVSVNGYQGHQAIKDQISYISTNGWMALEWQLTVLENLKLYGQIFGVYGIDLLRRCERVLRTFGMSDVQNRQISQLSAGMRQKVTLMRGLLIDRPVLYLDEPTVSLDVLSARQLRDIVAREARENGKTVLITSHQPEDLSICDRILFLHQGNVVGLDTPDALAAPLRGVSALQLTCKGDADPDYLATIQNDLEALPVVQAMQLDNGSLHTWSAKLLLQGAEPETGPIVDALIAHDMTITRLEMHQTTLLELYEHYVEQYATTG